MPRLNLDPAALLLLLVTLADSACARVEDPETGDTGDEAPSSTVHEPELDPSVTSTTSGDTTTGDASGDASGGASGDTTTGDTSGDTSGGTGGDTGGDTGGAPDEAIVACPEIPGVLLCEDFEDGLPVDRWTRRESEGNHAISSAGRAVTGERSLRLVVSAEKGSEAGIELAPETGVLPVPGNHLFGRVYIFTRAVPNKHSLWVTALGDLDGEDAQIRLDSWGDARRWKATYAHPSIEQHGGLQKNGGTIPVERWFCLEWEFDGESDALRFWVDGAPQDPLTVTGDEDPPWLAPTFTTFRIGHKTLQAPDNADEFNIWMDALVLATERVGCG